MRRHAPTGRGVSVKLALDALIRVLQGVAMVAGFIVGFVFAITGVTYCWNALRASESDDAPKVGYDPIVPLKGRENGTSQA